MASSTINILVSTFAGLGLPPTLSLAVPSSASITELRALVDEHLPASITSADTRLFLTTISNRQLPAHSSSPVSSLLARRAPLPEDSDDDDGEATIEPGIDAVTMSSTTTTASSLCADFLSLRLSAPLRGGKGGFGSQLRAAGGRMSSSKRRKNGQQQGEENGSSRNLDGRRLRTVNEAKALAEYLAVKPDMERREKEVRRRRWQEIVDLTERRQEEMRSGARAQLDGRWVEAKEEAVERAREAARAAVLAGGFSDNLLGTSAGSAASSAGSSVGSAGGTAGKAATAADDDDEDEMEDGTNGTSAASTPPPLDAEPAEKGKGKVPARTFFGFDEDDDFMSSDEEGGEGGAKAAK